jgi:hypothetical protein
MTSPAFGALVFGAFDRVGEQIAPRGAGPGLTEQRPSE